MAQKLPVPELGELPVATFRGPTTDRPILGQQVLKSGAMSDMVLVVKDVSFKVHRLALYTECKKIQMSSDRVILDADPNMVRHVLTYIYTNSVQIPQADLGAVATVADVMGVNDLHVWCTNENLATATITSDNCLPLLLQAYDKRDKKLIKRITTVALGYFAKVKRTKTFTKLPVELLKMYLLHDDLKVRTADERFSAALTWVRTDPPNRQYILIELLQSQQLSHLSPGFLDHILDDFIIQQLREVQERIIKMLDGTENLEKKKKDLEASEISRDQIKTSVEQENLAIVSTNQKRQTLATKTHVCAKPASVATVCPPRERCLVFVGAWIAGKKSLEVKAVNLDNLRVVSLGTLPASFLKDNTVTSCCVQEDRLYVSGLGDQGQEVWCYDLQTQTSTIITRLRTGRSEHSMTVLSDGRLCLFGGHSPPHSRSSISSVEVVDVSARTSTQVGQLRYWECPNLMCCRVGEQILVAGAWDVQYNACIQVWDVATACITHSISLPDSRGSWVFGVVHVQDHLVVVNGYYTCVCLIKDILQGCSDCLRLCDKYTTPNLWCSVLMSSDGQSLLLLGGEPWDGQPKHYAYRAAITDILHNTLQGWQPVDTSLNLGKCKMYGGYDVANIPLPQ